MNTSVLAKKCADCSHTDQWHMDEAGEFTRCYCGCPQFFTVIRRPRLTQDRELAKDRP